MTSDDLIKRIKLILDRSAQLYDESPNLAYPYIYTSLFDVYNDLRGVDCPFSDYTWQFFVMDEFLRSTTAQRLGITLRPSQDVVSNLANLVRKVLDPARLSLGKPIYISSGYRNPQLNKAVGGVSNSLHLCGRAADISCYDNDKLHDILSTLPHTELIYHKPSYIHVAL